MSNTTASAAGGAMLAASPSRRAILAAAPAAALAAALPAAAIATTPGFTTAADPIFDALDVEGLIYRARLVGMVPYAQCDGKVGMVCGTVFDQMVTAGRITFGGPLPVIERGDALPASGMAEAIERHRAAWDRFGAAVTACDKFAPGYDPSAAEANKLIHDEANNAELEALAELIAVVPANMGEVRMRFAHLLAVDAKAALDCDDLATLFETMA